MTQRLGAQAHGYLLEVEALRLLLPTYNAGVRLLARNVHWPGGEIDAILEEPGKRGLTLVFVEIRHRARSGQYGVLETLSATKRQRISRGVAWWCARNRGAWRELRVDLWMGEGTRWQVLRDLRL